MPHELLSSWRVEPSIVVGVGGALHDVAGLALEVLAAQPPVFLRSRQGSSASLLFTLSAGLLAENSGVTQTFLPCIAYL